MDETETAPTDLFDLAPEVGELFDAFGRKFVVTRSAASITDGAEVVTLQLARALKPDAEPPSVDFDGDGKPLWDLVRAKSLG